MSMSKFISIVVYVGYTSNPQATIQNLVKDWCKKTWGIHNFCNDHTALLPIITRYQLSPDRIQMDITSPK